MPNWPCFRPSQRSLSVVCKTSCSHMQFESCRRSLDTHGAFTLRFCKRCAQYASRERGSVLCDHWLISRCKPTRRGGAHVDFESNLQTPLTALRHAQDVSRVCLECESVRSVLPLDGAKDGESFMLGYLVGCAAASEVDAQSGLVCVQGEPPGDAGACGMCMEVATGVAQAETPAKTGPAVPTASRCWCILRCNATPAPLVTQQAARHALNLTFPTSPVAGTRAQSEPDPQPPAPRHAAAFTVAARHSANAATTAASCRR